MKKRVIKLTESDLEKLVRKIINEVGGYDDPNVMGLHAGHVMSNLVGSYEDIANMISSLTNVIRDGKVTKEDIVDYLDQIVNELSVIKKIIRDVISDFTEDKLVEESKNFIKKINKFISKSKILLNYSNAMGGEEEFKGRVVELLLDLASGVRPFGEELDKVNSMFKGRFGSSQNMN
jgi:hypothetical protein